MIRYLLPAALFIVLWGCEARRSDTTKPMDVETRSLQTILAESARIPSTESWFEIIRLHNRVYALWEPGHVERVNAFLVLGRDRDLLYDTGMGIASVRIALADIRAFDRLSEKPLIVINSHNHLDHNGGNREFNRVHTADDDWARHRLQRGVPAGAFVAYWNQLTDYPGVKTPPGFDPATHTIHPYPLEQVGYLAEGDAVDLGDRTFRVIRTFSHSPDGIALYEPAAQLFFGGDTFYGAEYLVTDITLLAADLRRVEDLPVRWHYASHGPQLITAMQHGNHLARVERIIGGEGDTTSTTFAGVPLPVQSLDGVSVIVAKELLLY